MTNEQDLFAPAKDAGLRQAELAQLAGVSRLTACYWMNGKAQPHPLHSEKVKSLLDRIDACVTNGSLPVSPRLKGSARMDKIMEAIANV